MKKVKNKINLILKNEERKNKTKIFLTIFILLLNITSNIDATHVPFRLPREAAGMIPIAVRDGEYICLLGLGVRTVGGGSSETSWSDFGGLKELDDWLTAAARECYEETAGMLTHSSEYEKNKAGYDPKSYFEAGIETLKKNILKNVNAYFKPSRQLEAQGYSKKKLYDLYFVKVKYIDPKIIEEAIQDLRKKGYHSSYTEVYQVAWINLMDVINAIKNAKKEAYQQHINPYFTLLANKIKKSKIEVTSLPNTTKTMPTTTILHKKLYYRFAETIGKGDITNFVDLISAAEQANEHKNKIYEKLEEQEKNKNIKFSEEPLKEEKHKFDVKAKLTYFAQVKIILHELQGLLNKLSSIKAETKIEEIQNLTTKIKAYLEILKIVVNQITSYIDLKIFKKNLEIKFYEKYQT